VMFAMMTSFFPLAFLIFAVLGSILFGLATPSEAASMGALGGMFLAVAYRLAGIKQGLVKPVWDGQPWSELDGWLFSLGFGGIATLIIAVIYVVLYLIVDSVVGVELVSEPGFLIRPGAGVGLAVFIALLTRIMPGRVPLLGWLWPQRDALKRTYAYAGRGAVIGSLFGIFYLLCFTVFGLNATFTNHKVNWLGLDIGFFIGLATYFAWKVNDQDRLRESIYLTVRTSAMVCWLFVGSWTFSSVFSYLGGEQLIKEVVLSMDLSPVTFLLLAQTIIFFLGWPLEWSEIIIIFVPIFLPLLPHFGVDPLFFGILVALNLQTSFLTPPMAMAAYYLKGVAPPHVTLVQIFKGVLPFLSMIFLSMAILYVFPGIAMWLPNTVYGK
jgi:TRAP-type mannitol/chloroaromatic compound transport system permease large subunit